MSEGYVHGDADAPEFVTAEDFFDVAAAAAADNGAGSPAEAELAVARFMALDGFASEEEDTATSLIGADDEPLLSAGGMLLMYGDGGAGKTTLSLDAAAHLAAGEDWLGLPVPEPIRVTLIENEGPRGMFRRKVRQKIDAWAGSPFASDISILAEPWTRFTLRDPRHVDALCEHLSAHGSALVIMGPLVTLGTIGGGTPDEIVEFELLLGSVRELVDHPFAWWVVHHENKAGDVSGAWERVPDVLCHVQARGNGHTHLVWRKARWSSTLHGSSVDLTWAAGGGFTLVDADDRDLHAAVLEALRSADGDWHTAKEIKMLAGIGHTRATEVCGELVERGELLYAVGPPGRHPSSRCWALREREPDMGEPGSPLFEG